MKTALWISMGIVVVVALVLAGLAAGWTLWGRRLWAAGPPVYAAARDQGLTSDACDNWRYMGGRGMMMGGRALMPEGCADWGDAALGEEGSTSARGLSIEEAHESVEAYLAARGYAHLEIAEVMEFERNFYAIAREPDTGVGALELIVDKDSGAVGPEMGPNMMWNVRYGMHGRGGMWGSRGDVNAISPAQAVQVAQQWLDANRPGVSADEHADAFYGYYTIHTLEDGHVEGMLSVHGTTGQVWYHGWHGPFIQMIEGESH